MYRKNLKKLELHLPTVDQDLSCNGNTNLINTNKENMQNQLYQKGPACILPNLYLGAYYNAQNTQQLKSYGITCIINVASEIKQTPPVPGINYHHIHWKHGQSNLAESEFDNAIDKINNAHKHHQIVLIHCQQGIERSAALVLAFLLSSNWTLDNAISFVQNKAPGIRPNMELLYQLREYEQAIQHSSIDKQNIQTRTKRSNSITCSKRSRLFSTNTRRRRSSSVGENSTCSTVNNQKGALAITSMLVLLAAMKII